MNKPRIAILFPGALGDFICLLPALHALARDAQLEIFAKTEFADIVSADIQVRALERYEINRLFVAGAASEPRVRDFFSPYERIYSWMGNGQPVFAGELAAVAPRRGRLFAFQGADPALHQADYYVSCLGLSKVSPRASNLPPRPEALRWREGFWDKHGLKRKAVLVLAPGSGAKEKNWPGAYFAAIARWWRERTGGEAIVLVGPVEQERGGLDHLVDGFISARNLSLAQVAALLQRANLFVGNDSGISHLAAFVGAPAVALFGPSDRRRWSPRGPKFKVLSLGVACSPCGIDVMKSCPHRNCLNEFLPEKVIGELEKLDEVANLTRLRAGIRVQTESDVEHKIEDSG
jgi:ADP-heptose:LPS heptosyltransferase